MSVLSSSRYDQITHAISLLKAQIEEDNREQSGKYQLIGMKVKMIQEQTSESNQSLINYQKEANNRVDSFASIVKSLLQEILTSHPKNQGIDQLDRQLKELQICKEKLVKSSEFMTNTVVQKLEREIEELQQKFLQKSEESKRQMKQFEQQIKKEIELTRKKIEIGQQYINSSFEIQKLQQLGQQLSKEIAGLRMKRKQRKEHFLNLLEAIVLKCKQNQEQI